MALNKTVLGETVAQELGVSKKQGQQAVEVVLKAIAETLTNGDSVALTNFGTFSVATRAERQGVNPKTKEPITIPSAKTVKFKAGKSLREAVRGETAVKAESEEKATRKRPARPAAK